MVQDHHAGIITRILVYYSIDPLSIRLLYHANRHGSPLTSWCGIYLVLVLVLMMMVTTSSVFRPLGTLLCDYHHLCSGQSSVMNTPSCHHIIIGG